MGIEREEEFAAISKARRIEINNINTFNLFRNKIPDVVKAEATELNFHACNEEQPMEDLPF